MSFKGISNGTQYIEFQALYASQHTTYLGVMLQVNGAQGSNFPDLPIAHNNAKYHSYCLCGAYLDQRMLLWHAIACTMVLLLC